MRKFISSSLRLPVPACRPGVTHIPLISPQITVPASRLVIVLHYCGINVSYSPQV